MIEAVLRYGIHLVAALTIFVIGFTSFLYFGEPDKVRTAGFQALRWFTAGTVVAGVADIWLSGPTSTLFVPGAIAILVLMFTEYYIQVQEERAEDQ